MALTYSQIVQKLSDIEGILSSGTSQFDSAVTKFSQIVTALDKIVTDNPTTIADAQALLDADPTNTELQVLRQRIDLLLDDRATLKARAQAAETAVSGL